jgi:hypothetical protein
MFKGGQLLRVTLDKNFVTTEYSDGYKISFCRYDPLTKGDAWEEFTSVPGMVKLNDTCYIRSNNSPVNTHDHGSEKAFIA